MLDKPLGLREHLINDGFFNDTVDYLKIIDDYHTKEITPSAIDFFAKGFEGTGVHTIYIYYQIKSISSETEQEIRYISNQIGIPYNELVSFLTFILTSVNIKKDKRGNVVKSVYDKLTEAYSGYNSKAEHIVYSSLDFIGAFERKNIQVVYRPYSSLNFHPPFHGRYWLNENTGYIVDGSLNTFSKDLIFAQLMDGDNYSIIYRMLTNDVEPRRQGYGELNGDTIREANERIKRYLGR